MSIMKSFNSTLVQLKDFYWLHFFEKKFSFNSTLVQLKGVAIV